MNDSLYFKKSPPLANLSSLKMQFYQKWPNSPCISKCKSFTKHMHTEIDSTFSGVEMPKTLEKCWFRESHQLCINSEKLPQPHKFMQRKIQCKRSKCKCWIRALPFIIRMLLCKSNEFYSLCWLHCIIFSNRMITDSVEIQWNSSKLVAFPWWKKKKSSN